MHPWLYLVARSCIVLEGRQQEFPDLLRMRYEEPDDKDLYMGSNVRLVVALKQTAPCLVNSLKTWVKKT